MAELSVKVEMSSAVVRPGDTLVVASPRTLTDQQAADRKARLEQKLPGVEIVVVGEVSQMLVYEPAADAQE